MEELWGKVIQIIDSLRPETISLTKVSIIFQQYFSGMPPFGQGKKKSEFPDAFVLAALESWCQSNDQLMYVVSQDDGLKITCEGSERLTCVSSAAAFVDLAVRHLPESDLAELALGVCPTENFRYHI